ncbi:MULTISPECIES: amidase [Brenneria]|uniref:Amidase n=1 Tax=Brenneria nigrifluens DSM 30175 = ATCC 13028 TaxID=1121120 RepID=A0A2U1UM81_9GAMM|nr:MULTISPECIES: amidase [Brenneria]EHD20639.1 Amidase [Brenneria sp. EniD312]PWC22692.1 amidase [Brenneria nigrifluens] [Brenneria nigrifluens DSM 30175 = ATCC 13028]QCR03821.1 amidase [Brenneria nigrifluens] [Brenneria nigrifluens DSM 30175 = ATCC 13028]
MQDNAFAFMPYPPAAVEHAPQGPLSGFTFAVKDLFDVAGYPTGGGSPHILAMSGIKRRTAPTVRRLLDAGAEFVGKTHTNEMAFSMSGKNAHYGTPRNGAAPERIPGGSSSGSAAAVSNRLCDFALGTDTGGSIRTPASYCGLFGLRPSHGRISLDDCQPLAPSMDTAGYFTRDADLFERVGECLLGEDDAPLPPQAQWVISHALFDLLPAASQQALRPALESIKDVAGELSPLSGELPALEEAYWAFRFIQGREAWLTQGEKITRYGFALGPDVAGRFAWGAGVTDEQYQNACRVRERFRDAWQALLGNRILVLPTVPDIAPLLDARDEDIEQTRQLSHHLLSIAVLCGIPQLNLPLTYKEGAPLGISLIGPRGSDLSLVRAAARVARRHLAAH